MADGGATASRSSRSARRTSPHREATAGVRRDDDAGGRRASGGRHAQRERDRGRADRRRDGREAHARPAAVLPPDRVTGAEVVRRAGPEARAPSASRPPCARTTGPGVEMEALTAAAVAALSLYDTAKEFDRAARIDGLRCSRSPAARAGTTAPPDSLPAATERRRGSRHHELLDDARFRGSRQEEPLHAVAVE